MGTEIDFALQHIGKAIEELRGAEGWLRDAGYGTKADACSNMWTALEKIVVSLEDGTDEATTA